METGKVNAPAPKHLKTLADIYGIDFTELMTLAGHPSGPFPMRSSTSSKDELYDGQAEAQNTGDGRGSKRSEPFATGAQTPLSRVSDPQARAGPVAIDHAHSFNTKVTPEERAAIALVVREDLEGLTLDEVRQVRAFIAGLRAARR
jgi:hypothetical protein